jgi:hypothetical protein
MLRDSVMIILEDLYSPIMYFFKCRNSMALKSRLNHIVLHCSMFVCNIFVTKLTWVPLGIYPGLDHMEILLCISLRNLHSDLQRGWTNLHFTKMLIGIPFSSHPHQHFLGFLLLFPWWKTFWLKWEWMSIYFCHLKKYNIYSLDNLVQKIFAFILNLEVLCHFIQRGIKSTKTILVILCSCSINQFCTWHVAAVF